MLHFHYHGGAGGGVVAAESALEVCGHVPPRDDVCSSPGGACGAVAHEKPPMVALAAFKPAQAHRVQEKTALHVPRGMRESVQLKQPK